MGVTVTRMSMNLHTQVLSQACSYTEGKHILVNIFSTNIICYTCSYCKINVDT